MIFCAEAGAMTAVIEASGMIVRASLSDIRWRRPPDSRWHRIVPFAANVF
jgi:hypothetical protein